ncbi:MAG: hypothetical protein OZ919_01900 [Xanthomonadaceae bacterium]|nr:hypothetical protein [Xanthomonadaceae bacterium]
MLSLWEPPARAGAPIGVLATTFTLDTALFEEECLARFAGVQSDPRRDGALYRIEREEKLASLLCAAVVADVHHCGGRRSLRWDLLASRPSSGVMHAKISVLVWNDLVRVIVASANLTSEGYRRSQECAAVLEFDRDSADRGLVDPLIAFLREILETTSGTARVRAENLLKWVDETLPRSLAPARGLQRRLVLTGPNRESLFDQLSGLLPAGRPELAHVVSPFFDGKLRPGGPEPQLWAMLRQRGNAELHLHVAGEYAPETGQWRLQVPEHVLQSPPSTRSGAVLYLHPVDVGVAPTDSGPERRPLHAKMLTLRHSDWIAWLVGSSNFTSAGTGLSKHQRNFEANVLYWVRADSSDAMYKAIETGGLRGGAAVDLRTNPQFAPAFNDEGADGVSSPPPLPALFLDADLLASTDDRHQLTLSLNPSCAPVDWFVSRDAQRVLACDSWNANGQPATVRLELPVSGPPPSSLTVEWTDTTGARNVADWPVNVRSASALPPPEELRGLTLAALLELLSSARPLHETIRCWLRRQPDDDDPDEPDDPQGPALVDPHKKVDTSSFLMRRVQRACGALQHLRERLAEPVLSESALVWRLDGPVGARAVVSAIERQCDPEMPDEWAFLLCELTQELEGMRLKDAMGGVVEPAMQARLDTFVKELRERLDQALGGASGALRTYVTLAEGKGETT